MNTGLAFIIYYNIVAFSLMFFALTIVSIKVVHQLQQRSNNIGVLIKTQIRNLTIMFVTFDLTFLLWVVYLATLIPRVS